MIEDFASPTRLVSRLLSLSPPVAIAHRGGAKLRPENTLPAFEHALTLGVDALECDVHLSRDGEPVLIHDATLDRTTDAFGPVSGLTADELSRVDAGYRFGASERFPFRGRGVSVPRLSALLDRSAGVPVIVEIKGEDPRIANRVIDVVSACAAEGRIVLAGFSQVVLATARRRAPDLVTSASRLEVQAALRRAYVRLAPSRAGFQLMQVPLRLRGQRVLSRTFVRVLRRAGIPVQAWIVDEIEDMQRVLDWGVTGIISDRPDRAVEVIKERGSRLKA
jgi:glycerophosphoryl diester phosphodiesterase